MMVLSNLPVLAIFVVAAVLALARWDKHPTTSVLVLTAAGVGLFSRFATFLLPGIMSRMDSVSGTATMMIYGITGLTSNLGLALLVAAAFSDRSTRAGLPPSQFR